MSLHKFLLSLILVYGVSGLNCVLGETVDLDESADPLKSCTMQDIIAAMEGIQIVSWSKGTGICESATSSLGQPMPVGAFRHLLKASGLLHIKGAGEVEKIAYQLTEIIEARGITDSKRMKDTIEIAYKAYNGSNGRVSPKELNVAIRQSGLGLTLSDEGVFGITAVISVQKRNNGE